VPETLLDADFAALTTARGYLAQVLFVRVDAVKLTEGGRSGCR
jgi:hypothetical protein